MIRLKIDHKYPYINVEFGQKIDLGARFVNRRFCTSVALVCARKCSY